MLIGDSFAEGYGVEIDKRKSMTRLVEENYDLLV